MQDNYGAICCYCEDNLDIDNHVNRRYFITEAPNYTAFTPLALTGPGVTVSGQVSIKVANGEAVYEIVGVSHGGNIHGRKISATLTPYTPKHERLS